MKESTWRIPIQSLFAAAAMAIGMMGVSRAGTPFTYQGLLTDSNRPANGLYDLRFTLYADATNTTPLGQTVTNLSVAVSNGLFTVELNLQDLAGFVDPEVPPFPPPPNLEVAARAAGSGDPFLLLGPRQKLTAAPWSAYADLAKTVPNGSLTAAKFGSNSVTSPALAPGAVRTHHIENFSVTYEKLAPGAIPHSCFDYTNCYWSLCGNGNVTAGVNFLGTGAGELDPLEFRVNNNRAMLYVFTGAGTSPNLIGGYGGNVVSGVGGTIAGGGQASAVNVVRGDWGAIGGGYTNVIDGTAPSSTIAGGFNNYSGANASSLGGGSWNRILTSSSYGTIPGGQFNLINSNATHGVIGGGNSNRVEAGTQYATVGGGQWNKGGATWSTVAGGVNNTAGGVASTVGGGNLNSAGGGDATVAGGFINSASGWRTVVGGGANNSISADYAGLLGGYSNAIVAGASYASIGGGYQNQIPSTGASATIAGGWANNNAANAAAIGGGDANVITSGASYATVAGGRFNNITTAGQFATVPGGLQAKAAEYGQMAYASGAFANAGDAQSSLFVARRITTTNTATELFLDGSSRRINVPAGATWTFDILVVGRSTAAATSAGYQIRGLIENNAGTITVVRTATPITEDDATWNADVDPTDSNTYDALVIKVTGAPTATVRWVASVRTAEVDVD